MFSRNHYCWSIKTYCDCEENKPGFLWSLKKLRAGVSKTSFGQESDQLLHTFPVYQRQKLIKSFQQMFHPHLNWDKHPANPYYKAARIFDPQLATISHSIFRIHHLSCLSNGLFMWWYSEGLSNPLSIYEFWQSMRSHFPKLSAITAHAVWMPVISVNFEKSFL